MIQAIVKKIRVSIWYLTIMLVMFQKSIKYVRVSLKVLDRNNDLFLYLSSQKVLSTFTVL
jgi:hypothetical protein